MSRWHDRPVEQLFQELESRPSGLTERQAQKRLEDHGPNELQPPPQAGLLRRILEQMKDPMILVLLGAAGLSLAASGGEDWLDAAIILIIVMVNNVISITQEDHAQKALEELRKLSSPQARVVREGRETRMEAARLVPGDVILLEAGDQVPADCRLLACAGLRCDESAMTGESVPAEKELADALLPNAPMGDWKNMVLSGTLVTTGRGCALVCATGMDTQMGHIAGLLLEGETQATPLQLKMAEKSLVSVPDGLCGHVRGGPAPGQKHAGHVPDRRLPGRGGHPGGTARHRHHCAGPGRAADGGPGGYRQKTPGGGDAGLCLGHLLRQDRHPDPEQNDRPGAVASCPGAAAGRADLRSALFRCKAGVEGRCANRRGRPD